MKFHEMNKVQFQEALRKIDTVIIPAGAMEAHGPHLPINTDSIIASAIVDAVDRKIGDKVLVAPLINYGHVYFMGDHVGTLSTSENALTNYVYDICRSFVRLGLKNIVLLNCHGGNTEILRHVGEKISELGARIIVFSWWESEFSDILSKITSEKDYHGGDLETSVVLYYDEQLVNKSGIPEKPHDLGLTWPLTEVSIYDKEANMRVMYPEAYSGNPIAANKDKGKKFVESFSDVLVELLEKVSRDELAEES